MFSNNSVLPLRTTTHEHYLDVCISNCVPKNRRMDNDEVIFGLNEIIESKLNW